MYAFRIRGQGVGWRSYEVEWSPRGVWGVDDRNVWVWGEEYGAGALYRWNGGQREGNWDEARAPGEIRAMHGERPDHVLAVGDGFVARWDGEAWHYEPGTSEARLSSVFVAGDEAWACGEDGELWVRRGDAWSLRLRHSRPLRCVAKWHGAVWVGEDGELGLSVLEGDALVSRKPNLRALQLDARRDLLIGCEDVVAATANAERFRGTKVEKVALFDGAGGLTKQVSG